MTHLWAMDMEGEWKRVPLRGRAERKTIRDKPFLVFCSELEPKSEGNAAVEYCFMNDCILPLSSPAPGSFYGNVKRFDERKEEGFVHVEIALEEKEKK